MFKFAVMYIIISTICKKTKKQNMIVKSERADGANKPWLANKIK